MIEIGSALDPGRKRITAKNQDALCVVRAASINHGSPLLVIADGMGGYEGGAIASQLVVRSFSQVFRRSADQAAPIEILKGGVDAALDAMKQHSEQDPDLIRMGSTVVAVVLKDRCIYLLNVGDSRAYLVNDQHIRQLSYDHSLVGEQVRLGIISAEEARTHPRRNVLSMSISAQRGDIHPFMGEFEWKPADRLVLCSDGLWGPVLEPEIQAVVLGFAPQEAADRLVQIANNNQGPDNISVIVAEWME